jgi:hypothetical protein
MNVSMQKVTVRMICFYLVEIEPTWYEIDYTESGRINFRVAPPSNSYWISDFYLPATEKSRGTMTITRVGDDVDVNKFRYDIDGDGETDYELSHMSGVPLETLLDMEIRVFEKEGIVLGRPIEDVKKVQESIEKKEYISMRKRAVFTEANFIGGIDWLDQDVVEMFEDIDENGFQKVKMRIFVPFKVLRQRKKLL